MSKFLVLSIFILSAFSNVLASEPFQKDCQEVGDYIHKNAGNVHNALYVLYNGTGEKKAHTFEKVFQYNSLSRLEVLTA